MFVSLASLTSAVIEGPHTGWTSWTILGLFAASGASLAIFFFYEPRRNDPLVDLRFFRSIPFSSATLLALCAFASFAGFLFLNALYLQQARGFSAFHTGLCTLPLAIMMMVSAPLSGRLVGRYGTRPSLLAAGGAFLLSTLLLTRLVSVLPFPCCCWSTPCSELAWVWSTRPSPTTLLPACLYRRLEWRQRSHPPDGKWVQHWAWR